MTVYRAFALPALLLFLLLPNSSAFGQEGFGGADADEDGKVSAAEMKEYVSGKLQGFDRFDELMKKLDKDEDGFLSEEEFGNRMTAVRSLMSQGEPDQEQAEMEKKEEKPKQEGRRRRGRDQKPSLKVGDVAPGFKLDSLDGKSETELGQYKGKKPVILIFGSYT